MNKIESLLSELFDDGSLIKIVFGNPRKKSNACKKLTIRPFLKQGQLQYQLEFISDNKACHENIDPENCLATALRLSADEFKQINIFTSNADYQVLAANYDHPKIIKKPASKELRTLEHDRSKSYVIPDGVPCDFLIALGVMDKSGKVHPKHYAKFRQINRFLEIVRDADAKIPKDSRIIDFGCGKAYLTFALYFYLNGMLNKNVEIIGLDLKHDVIEFCTKTAADLNYDRLTFQFGDIAEFTGVNHADMVVTLHACDTATDFALMKAVKWNASVILSVPCCQHELFSQLSDEQHGAMFSHGILKERFSAILTDGLRSLKLEAMGYDVDLIEFTSLEHTSKNIMIRAVKSSKSGKENSAKADTASEQYESLKKYWHVRPAIDLLKHSPTSDDVSSS